MSLSQGGASQKIRVQNFSIFDVTRKPLEPQSPRSERSQGRSPAICPGAHASVGQASRSFWPGHTEVVFCPELWDPSRAPGSVWGGRPRSDATGAKFSTRPCGSRHGPTPGYPRGVRFSFFENFFPTLGAVLTLRENFPERRPWQASWASVPPSVCSNRPSDGLTVSPWRPF